jgi:hypothetical protein
MKMNEFAQVGTVTDLTPVLDVPQYLHRLTLLVVFAVTNKAIPPEVNLKVVDGLDI